MASFPNAKKTFSSVVNGVTKLVAALFNTPYDEIEAIETYIGATGGGAQAYSESLKGLLIGYRRGCNVEYKGTADLYVRLGEICIPDASGNIRLRRNTTDTTVTWANIDTGAEEASTTYYVYAVADASATTFTVMISKSATTPTGATFYKKLGSFFNDASSNIASAKNTNTAEISATKVYDSGWFSVTAGQTYAKTHGLGTTKLITKVYFSNSATGESNVFEVHYFIYSSSTQMGSKVIDITTTTMNIYTGSTYVANLKVETGYSTGYLRVVVLALE
jgi:hypothetical protein